MQAQVQINSNESPKIRSYIHIFQYFTDYYNYRKRHDDRFSHEIWAAELDFKSRSQMRMIAAGKRNATELVIKKFCQKNQVSRQDFDHLNLMMYYSKARTAVQKKLYLDQILENLETCTYQIEEKNYVEFLSRKELPLLQLLLGIPDFEGTKSHIKQMLNLNKTELETNLSLLQKLQLISEQKTESKKDSRWVSQTHNFKVSDQHQSEALKIYHRDTIEEMKSMLDRNLIMRRFRSIMFNLSEQNFTEFIDEIEIFLKKVKLKYGAESIENKYIFKLNLNTYPVTEKYKK